MAPSAPDTPTVDASWSDDDEAKQKQFNIMAGVGVLVVLVLGYVVVAPGGDEAAPVTIVGGGGSTAATAGVAEAPTVAAAAAPLPPGVSGGSGGGGGGGGRPTSGPAATKAAGSVVDAIRTSALERYTSLGLRPRAAAALADSAARRAQPAGAGRAPQAGSQPSGSARVARATVLMASPGGGAAATIPAGASVSLSGCQPQGETMWCQVSYNGMTGYVRQSDVQG